MSQLNLKKLKCTETGHIHYVTRISKKRRTGSKEENGGPLKLKKFNPLLKRHTLYKEAKK